MAILTIGGKSYEAKTNFKFEKLADKKYKDPNKENELSGLEVIYQELLSYKVSGLLKFWVCATAHYGKDQPSLELIEEAIEAELEENKDNEEFVYKEAFQTLDNSGFFRLQLKEFWNNLNMIDKMVKDEKEKEQAIAAREMYLAKRQELNPKEIVTE